MTKIGSEVIFTQGNNRGEPGGNVASVMVYDFAL